MANNKSIVDINIQPDNAASSKLGPALRTILVLSFLVFLVSLFGREITLDDAYFAERSYWFEKNGYVKSELFRGVLDWGERSFVYHKMHIWQGALLIKLVGWGPYYFKSLPLLYLIVFVVIARVYFKNFITRDRTVFYLFLTLLFVHTFISQYGFEFRPEIMIMSVGFGSFLGIRYGLTRNNLNYIILAGVLAGVAALFHLNGLIFITAGLGLLVVNKAYRPALAFGIASALVFSVYFLELIPADNFTQYLDEFKNNPAISEDELGIWGWLLKVATGPERYFSHLYEASFTILFLYSLILNWKKIVQTAELKQVLLYLLLLELALSIIAPGAKTMYLTYHIPYMLIVISSTFYLTLKQDLHRNIFFFLLVLFAGTQYGHTYSIATKNRNTHPDTHATIVEKYHINKDHKILSPEIFIFNEIENAKIQGFTSVRMTYGEQVFSTLDSLLDFAFANSDDYVILNEEIMAETGAGALEPGIRVNQYQLAGAEEGLYIFRNMTDNSNRSTSINPAQGNRFR